MKSKRVKFPIPVSPIVDSIFQDAQVMQQNADLYLFRFRELLGKAWDQFYKENPGVLRSQHHIYSSATREVKERTDAAQEKDK